MSGLIPAPARLLRGDGSYTLPARVRFDGAVDAVGASVRDAIVRINALTPIEASIAVGADPAEVRLEITGIDEHFVDIADPQGRSPLDGDPRDERHVVEVRADGITVRAGAPEGLARGLATLTQLIVTSAGEHDVTLGCQTIVDAPRFAWRGLSFDVVRTFFGPDEVHAVIDMLALHKMNVLHLHLSDDQGWRLQIPSLPLLTEIGAAGAFGDRPGGFYSEAEFAGIVCYAADRFITIVPEIDVPGHTAAIFAAYPELRSPELPVGIAFLDPRLEATTAFLTTVFEHLARVVPGAYLHVGGDEAFGMPEQLYRHFIARILPIVRATGKKIVGWQEIARGELDAGDVVQYWIHGTDLANSLQSLPPEYGLDADKITAIVEQFKSAALDLPKAQAHGAGIILSPTSVAYLDTPYAEPSLDAGQEARRAQLGLAFYPAKSTRESMGWTPSTVVAEAEMDNVVGVEAAIWCETVDTLADLHMLLLPRLAGVAEKAWTVESPTDWDDYRVRLGAQAPLWRQAGWAFFESSLVDWE